MIWNICFTLSLLILLFSILGTINAMKTYKSGRLRTPFNTMFVGVFLAVTVGMVPVFSVLLEKESWFGLRVIIFSILEAIQVFTINVEAGFILENIQDSGAAIAGAYSPYMAFLFIFAAILTFGFIISLFKNVLVDAFYILHYFDDAYIFSELNDNSIALAGSIKQHHANALIVFTNVDREEGDIESELIESANELNAIIFSKDIVTVNFSRHSKQATLNFFTIGGKESTNILESVKLIEKMKNRPNTGIYAFSTGAEGELLLANAHTGEVKVRRVNEVRSLIYKFLYDEGPRLFESAYAGETGDDTEQNDATVSNDNNKEINAVVVGLGRYGTEMLKALTWYTQMDGYTVNIHAFDKDELAEEKFAALCPELMSPSYNGVKIPGESEYTIHIHSGVDVKTRTFAEKMAEIKRATFVFVCLGNDTENINQAANIRMLCERAGAKPIIMTVVYSAEEKEALQGITNYRGQEYRIETIGDLESTYSEEILIGSELEKLALQRHLKWGEEKEFWQYEYNYRSSMASAVHMRARVACGIPGAGKEEDSLTGEERDIIEHLEHRRWNTYMRSEGYVYSGSPDKSSRNDLAKMHHDLVDFDRLSEEDKRKDSSVGTK